MLSNQHRLLGEDTRHRAVRRGRGDRGHSGVGEVARGVDAGQAGFAALVDLEDDAVGPIDRGEAKRFMQACGWLVARMREQDVDRNLGAGIEHDGGAMAPVMADFGDPAIDDGYTASPEIGPNIGEYVLWISELM